MVPKFTQFLLKPCCYLNLFVLFSGLTIQKCKAQNINLNSSRSEQLARLQAVEPIPPETLATSSFAEQIPPPQEVLQPSTPTSQPSQWLSDTPNIITPKQLAQLQDVQPAPPETLPTPSPPEKLPPPEELLQPSTPTPQPSETLPDTADTVMIKKFEVVGSTVFSQEELAQVLKPFTNKPITFGQLLQARSAITQFYIDNKYINSEAYIPTEQSIEDGVVKIIVIESKLEEIEITGLERLKSSYVRSRIAIAAKSPLNQKQLLDSLQLLQRNPLIDRISAKLSTGTRPGLNILSVELKEAPSFDAQVVLDNSRPSIVGSFRRGVKLNEANLLGFGDSVSIEYDNSDGSDIFDFNYTLPVSPGNATLSFKYRTTSSTFIGDEGRKLNLGFDSSNYELTFRQPLVETPRQEFALGFTAARRSQKISFPEFESNEIPFNAFFSGTDDDGNSNMYLLRFFQEWTSRNRREVIAARSEFSAGFGTFRQYYDDENFDDESIDDESFFLPDAPDRRFFLWRGRVQWLRLLAPDTFLLVRGGAQLAPERVVPSEQFNFGIIEQVRNGHQKTQNFLGDNGVFASAEVQLPILRVQSVNGILKFAPFVDIAHTWKSAKRINFTDTIVSVGLGLRWSQGDKFTARLDWGIPFTESPSSNGLYFSVKYNPF